MGERHKIFNFRCSDEEKERWRAGALERGFVYRGQGDLTGWIRFLMDRELGRGGSVLTEGAVGSVYTDTIANGDGASDDAEDRLPPPGGPVPAALSVSARLAELPAARPFNPDFKKEPQNLKRGHKK